MDDLDKLTDALTELGDALRRLTLYISLYEVTTSALGSDAPVIEIPRYLTRLERRELSDN